MRDTYKQTIKDISQWFTTDTKDIKFTEYPAKVIANEFLRLAWEEEDLNEDIDYDMTQIKLQKLVYIAHGFHLAIFDKELIKERVEAWKYGPVIHPLWAHFYSAGSDKIDEYTVLWRFDKKDMSVKKDEKFIEHYNDNPEVKNLIKEVWNIYKLCNGKILSHLTHLEGSPWSQTRRKEKGANISNRIIRKYYLKKTREVN